MKMQLTVQVRSILARLNHAGHEVYIVGGAVRDSLQGILPHDYDLTTSATPQQIKSCFADCRTIDVGIQHGTVMVMMGQTPFEITTYRTESGYTDHRHPDAVCFSTSLTEDLKRRDFTINAMAYHPNEDLVDPFEGALAIRQKVIQTVGDPDQRFCEDALRILRGLRFASTTGFSIEINTLQAMKRHSGLLAHVSSQRKWNELQKLLMGQQVNAVLRQHHELFESLFPGMRLDGKIQTSDQLAVRLARICSFAVLEQLQVSRNAQKAVKMLQTARVATSPYDVKRLLQQYGEDNTKLILQYQNNTAAAKWCQQILHTHQCYCLDQLAIDGNDLLQRGCQNSQVGKILNDALREVQQEKIMNQRDQLLGWLDRQV